MNEPVFSGIFNYFSVSLLIGGLVGLASASLVFFKNRHPLENKAWFLLNIVTAIWSFGYFSMITSYDHDFALWSNWILHGAAIFIPPFYLLFTAALTRDINKYRNYIWASFIVGLILFLFNPTTLFVRDVIPKYAFRFVCDAGPLYIYFTAHFFIWIILAEFILLKAVFRTKGLVSQQLKYVLLTTLVGFSGGASVFFLTFNIPFPPYPLILFSLYPIIITYAIVRYRLMNVKLIITRSILYFALVSLIGSIFVFSTYITTQVFVINSDIGLLGANFITSIVAVFLFDPLKKLLSRLTDDIFYKGKIEYEQVLEKISRILAQEIDLELLLSKVKQGIETEVKIKKVDVWVKMNGKFYSFSDKAAVEGTFEPEFISYLQKENNLIVTEELKRQLYDLPEGAARTQLDKMAAIIDRLHWEMAIPVTNKGEVTAILGLHHKLSGDIYTGEEINFFGIVAGQLAVAIEKSKLYEEVGRFNEELQAKVDRATQRLRQNNIDLEARNKFLTTTQNISNLISRSLEIKNIIQVIADSIASELGYIGGILSFADADKKFLYAAAITRSEAGMKALSMLPRPANEYKSSVKNKDNLGVKIYSSGQAMTGSKLSDFLSPPVEKDVMDKIQLTLGVQTVVGVPIYAENEIIGVIDYLLAVPEAQISKLDMEMMNNLADQIGIVYRNVKLYQELEGANKELQQANFHLMQLDKAKSEFLSIASHQLRTPVSAIKGYLSMMIEGDFGVVKPEQKKIITDVFESASRLARTINVFLNVSRIEAGRFKLTKAPIDMNTVTEGVIKELKQQAAIKNVKLEWIPPAKPCTIIVDGDKVREVVLNLVDNSIKYTQEGFVRVTQDMTPTEFHFQVTDSGMGILPEEVGTLFKKFVRGTGVAQVNTSGSGLGLYIAQRVVKEHGGKIWVESPGVGKGSTFQFTIPIETVVSDKVQSKEMIESSEAKPLTESKEKK